MNRKWTWHNYGRRLSCTFGAATVGAMFPLTVLADTSSASPVCNALALVTNNLYLVDGSGSPLLQFTSDGLTRDHSTVAPDGHRIAWLTASQSDDTYQVRDAWGHEDSFDPHADDRSGDVSAAGPLMGVAWSSNGVLQLEKHEGPQASRFEYHRIDGHDSTAPLVGQPGTGVACTQHGDVACVQDAEIQVNGVPVFDQAPFSGGMPQASVIVAKGATATMPGTSGFTVQILGFSGNTIGIQITYPNGQFKQQYVPAGVSVKVTWKFVNYGFTATLVDPQAGSVRIDEFLESDQPAAFDPAIAWTPVDHGLLTVYRDHGQAVMYLVRPGQDEDGQHDHADHSKSSPHDGHSHDDNNSRSGWSLVAQAPLPVTSVIKSMRFISSSMLLLQTDDGHFSELPVVMSQGHAAALSLGQATVLPQTLQVTLDPNTAPVQAQVLDWACGAPGYGDHDEGGDKQHGHD